LLLLATAVAGETIYKYRQPDGRTVYSNRVIPGAMLLETFEYEFSQPAGIQGDAEKRRLEAEERIRAHLAALEQAWNELQEARQALAAAEQRLRAGVEPLGDEPMQIVGPHERAAPTEGGPAGPAPPAVGGPQKPAPPAVGGPQKPAPPAVGGPLGTRHGGGGRSPAHEERMAALEADVKAAQERLDEALRRYNSLR
jgi:hypothetical protein